MVADYQSQFEVLVSRAESLTQDQKIQLYLGGLQEYIAAEVELHQPIDLVTAMSMSRLYEWKNWSICAASPSANHSSQLTMEAKGI